MKPTLNGSLPNNTAGKDNKKLGMIILFILIIMSFLVGFYMGLIYSQLLNRIMEKQSKADVTIVNDKHAHELLTLSFIKSLLESEAVKNPDINHITSERNEKFFIIGAFDTEGSVFFKFRIALDVFDRHKETYFKILT